MPPSRPLPRQPSWLLRAPFSWVMKGWLKAQHARGMPSGYRTLHDHRTAIEAYAKRVVDFHAWNLDQSRYRAEGNAVPLDRLLHEIERFSREIPAYGTSTLADRDVPASPTRDQAWLTTFQVVHEALVVTAHVSEHKEAWRAMRLVKMGMHAIDPENHAWRNQPLSPTQKQTLALVSACAAFFEPPNEAVDGYHREWQGFQQALSEVEAIKRKKVLEEAWSPTPVEPGPQAEAFEALPEPQASTVEATAPSPPKRPRF